MSLVVRARVELDGFALDVDLTCEPGTTVAVVGPNGAGKTTLLRAVAGLIPVTTGRIELTPGSCDVSRRQVPADITRTVVWDDAEAGTWLAPEHRHAGVVFQDHLLFPHLDAVDNVAFGLRCAGRPRADARTRAIAWLGRVGLADRAHARPGELSGGEAQRVALARALAPGPDVLLLDEPLAALDATTRVEVRTELRRHLADFPGVRLLVTHDPVDVATLADRVVVLERGAVVQDGTPIDVATRPRTMWVAALAGLNLLAGVADGARVALDGGGELALAEPAVAHRVSVAIPPRAVTLHSTRPRGSARNTWRGTAASIEPVGERVRVRVVGPPSIVAEVTAGALAELGLAEGDEVWVAVKATELDVYPQDLRAREPTI